MAPRRQRGQLISFSRATPFSQAVSSMRLEHRQRRRARVVHGPVRVFQRLMPRRLADRAQPVALEALGYSSGARVPACPSPACRIPMPDAVDMRSVRKAIVEGSRCAPPAPRPPMNSSELRNFDLLPGSRRRTIAVGDARQLAQPPPESARTGLIESAEFPHHLSVCGCAPRRSP